MKGLNMKDLKQHPSLIPLYICVVAGGLMATFYTLRLAIKNPDVSWDPKNKKEPWQEYSNKQYKFYTHDEFRPSPAPKY